MEQQVQRKGWLRLPIARYLHLSELLKLRFPILLPPAQCPHDPIGLRDGRQPNELRPPRYEHGRGQRGHHESTGLSVE